MTTIERRLAKVEAGLAPTGLVVRWLDEAHRYHDYNAYARALLDTDPSSFPLDRLAREAQENARAQTRGLSGDEADAAVHRAIVATVFRVQLVLRINVLTQEFLDREGLIQASLSAYLALTFERPAGRDEHLLPRVTEIRDLLLARADELHAFEAACAEVEARYLDGVAADFPAARQAWAEQRTRSETQAVVALRLAELDGAEPAGPNDHAALEARVASLAADFVEPARSKAYDELGDGRREMTIAISWLRPRLRAEPL